MRRDIEAPDLPRLDHLQALFVPAGVIQFARGLKPDLDSGTCLDDNARAWIVAAFALQADAAYRGADDVESRAAAFVRRAQRRDGRFHNLANADGTFLDDVGSEDAMGRAIWACGIAQACGSRRSSDAAAIMERGLPPLRYSAWPHVHAYALLGLSAVSASGIDFDDALRHHATWLCDRFDRESVGDWHWFAPDLTWGNARLPEALLRAALVVRDQRFAETGLRALSFLAAVTQPEGVFLPIGNHGWYARGAARALYDQQPIEACAMVDAWLAAHELTREERYRRAAREAFAWFFGSNSEKLELVESDIGACHDGLERGRVNANAGAESTLSYLHAALRLHRVAADL